jgi:flavin-dependent dehydrogenase
MRKMYDIIVIGGGPAGTAAAITAARTGSTVLLLERGGFPRQKVCGEFVSAESLELLASLLLSSDIELLKDAVQISSTRIFVDGRMLTAPVEPAAASIARLELDSALWRAAQAAGADVRERTPVTAISGEGPFVVATAAGDFEAGAVINATGRWSNLSRPADAKSKNGSRGNGANNNGSFQREKWIGLKGHFAEFQPSPSVDLYFFDGGYCGRVNACAMVRADVASKLEDVFTLSEPLRERSAGWQPLMEPVTTSPLIFRTPECVRNGIFLAGDAAGFVDPFVGDGISLALRSGTLVARTLAGALSNQESLESATASYRKLYEDNFGRVFRSSSRIRRLLAMPNPIRRIALVAAQASPTVLQYAVRATR